MTAAGDAGMVVSAGRQGFGWQRGGVTVSTMLVWI
jgi:hypothetical protein